MSITSLQKLKRIDVSRPDGGETEIDPAFHIVYSGSSTVLAKIDTNVLTVTIDGSANALDLSDSAYDTIGELWDAIEALDSGLTIIPVAAIRSDTTNANLPDVAEVTISTVGNAMTALWDIEASDTRVAAMGVCEDTDVPVQARTADLTAPFKRDGTTPSGQVFTSQKTAAQLDSIDVKATYTGAGTINIYRSTKAADTLIFTKAHTGTGNTDILDHDEFGPDGLQCNLGERIVVRFDAATALTDGGSTISARGWIMG